MSDAIQHVMHPNHESKQWFIDCAKRSAAHPKLSEDVSGLRILQWDSLRLREIAQQFKDKGIQLQMICHTNKMRILTNVGILQFSCDTPLPQQWTKRRSFYGPHKGEEEVCMPSQIIAGWMHPFQLSFFFVQLGVLFLV